MKNIEKNKELRARFLKFLNDNYNPSLRAIAKVIDINYQNLVSWKIGSLEYGNKTLNKIEDFLNSKKY